ncbi:MerR family DNA-binding transcriptional regulator [Pseudoalteromonas aliena]|nr:MerR family DNA-binding transcriptional regulator [Pseudoalteromonas aliena]
MKIGTLSSKTGFGIHTIRYYEKQGLIKSLKKMKAAIDHMT